MAIRELRKPSKRPLLLGELVSQRALQFDVFIDTILDQHASPPIHGWTTADSRLVSTLA